VVCQVQRPLARFLSADRFSGTQSAMFHIRNPLWAFNEVRGNLSNLTIDFHFNKMGRQIE
jgi:hypothetical protein